MKPGEDNFPVRNGSTASVTDILFLSVVMTDIWVWPIRIALKLAGITKNYAQSYRRGNCKRSKNRRTHGHTSGRSHQSGLPESFPSRQKKNLMNPWRGLQRMHLPMALPRCMIWVLMADGSTWLHTGGRMLRINCLFVCIHLSLSVPGKNWTPL